MLSTWVVHENGQGYASATGINEMVPIDMKALKVVARVPGGVCSDGMVAQPTGQKDMQ